MTTVAPPVLESFSTTISVRLFALAGAFILCGCASTPPVQLAATSKSQFEGAIYSGEVSQIDNPTPGADAFRAFYQGGSGFVSVSSVRGTVEEMATQHCARQGKIIRPLQEITSKGPHILGNFPRVELLFECSDRAASTLAPQVTIDKLSQIERLKKLLDSGALTLKEFESEKAKVLAAP